MFKDLPTSKATPSKIEAMSEEIRVQGLLALSVEPPRWETPSATSFTRSQNNPPKNMDDKNIVLPFIRDLSSNNDAKSDSDSDDKKYLSWKMSKKGFFYSAKASSETIKPLRIRLSLENLIRESLERSKENTKKRRWPKKVEK